MDILKNLVESKKRTLEGPATQGQKKWKRRGDANREKEAVEAAAEAEEGKALQNDTSVEALSGRELAKAAGGKSSKTSSEKVAEVPQSPSKKDPEIKGILSRSECFTRLRALG